MVKANITKCCLLLFVVVIICVGSEVATATTPYIGYGAIRGGSIPCSAKGSSGENCKTKTPVNPYRRACSQAERCRTGDSADSDDEPLQEGDKNDGSPATTTPDEIKN